MQQKKPEEPPESYYSDIIGNNNRISGPKPRKHYFEDTEPEEGRPTKTRVMHSIAAHATAQSFLNKIVIDITINSRFEWPVGSDLPDPDYEWPGIGGPRQPLGAGQYNGTANT